VTSDSLSPQDFGQRLGKLVPSVELDVLRGFCRRVCLIVAFLARAGDCAGSQEAIKFGLPDTDSPGANADCWKLAVVDPVPHRLLVDLRVAWRPLRR
jgi:hypothetical protein